MATEREKIQSLQLPISSGMQLINTGGMEALKQSAMTPAAINYAAMKGGVSASTSTGKGSGQMSALASQAFTNMAGGVAGGIGGILSGIIGSGQRRREQKAATEELNQRIAEYQAFEFKNAYENIENPAANLRVGLQAAEFQAQQTQQGLAQSLDALRAGGGGVGAAALAQALATSQAKSMQQIAGGIEQQELANERMYAQMEAQRQAAIATGAMQVQEMELGRTETLTDMAAQRKAEADLARQQATQSIVGGIGQLASAAASFGTMGGFTGGLQKFMTGGGQ